MAGWKFVFSQEDVESLFFRAQTLYLCEENPRRMCDEEISWQRGFLLGGIQRGNFGEEILLRHTYEVPCFLTESRKHIWGFATRRASSCSEKAKKYAHV
jgi:hypothetical protein